MRGISIEKNPQQFGAHFQGKPDRCFGGRRKALIRKLKWAVAFPRRLGEKERFLLSVCYY
jgi:hypothetical protein